MSFDTEYDGIIIGAGHNGMILAGYLAKAGLKVVCFEQALEIGGGLDTHEDMVHPGFYHNVHSFFHRNVMNLPWYRDLQLEKYGLVYIRPEINNGMVLSDGRSIIWYSDLDRTCQSIAKISPKDADTFRKLYHQWQGVVENVVSRETYSPPVPFDRKRAILEKSSTGREYLRIAAMSPMEVVDGYFENEQLKAMILCIAIIRGYEVHDKGLGFFIPSILRTWNQASMCKGTSHNLAHHLHKMVVDNGAELLEMRRVTRILVENGVAQGVELYDGTKIYARRFVASSVDPITTFVDLIDREKLDSGFLERVKKFKFSMVAPIFSVNLSLRDIPRYKAAEREPDVNQVCNMIAGLDTIDDIEEVWQAHREQRMPTRLWFNGTTPSMFDPTQAPRGLHTSFMWPLAPYYINGDPNNWDNLKDEVLELYLNRWREYAPNLTDEIIIHKFTNTPADITRHVPNMREGDQFVGEICGDQILDKRPIPELSQYRTPVKNLYLCGSSCHPGGNITGGPGYNAAKIIAEDLQLDKWWNPPDVEELWKKLD